VPAGLRDHIVVARQRVREVEFEQPIARISVALETPQGGHPQGRVVAVAVGEDHRRLVVGLRDGREVRCRQASKCRLQQMSSGQRHGEFLSGATRREDGARP
jgi:hypothetical protein